MVAAVVVIVSLVVVAGAYGFRDSTRRAPWVLMDVTRDGRGLVVGYVGGGCDFDADARTVQTPTRVSIVLDQAIAIPEGPNEACTADLRFYSLVVPLVNPIAGRRLVGQASSRHAGLAGFGPFRPRGEDFVLIVPRVIGLAPLDARRMLRAHGYHVRVVPAGGRCAKRAQVVAQTPRAHADRGRGRRIQIAVRRACG